MVAFLLSSESAIQTKGSHYVKLLHTVHQTLGVRYSCAKPKNPNHFIKMVRLTNGWIERPTTCKQLDWSNLTSYLSLKCMCVDQHVSKDGSVEHWPTGLEYKVMEHPTRSFSIPVRVLRYSQSYSTRYLCLTQMTNRPRHINARLC